MFLKTEKILIPVVWLVMASVGLWGHMTLPDAPIAVHFGSGGADGFMPRDSGLMVMPGLALVLMVVLLWIVPAVMPNRRRNRRENALGLSNPLTIATSLIASELWRTSSAARRSRCFTKNLCGVSPYTHWNARMKCVGE
jgi:hypothetical protein